MSITRRNVTLGFFIVLLITAVAVIADQLLRRDLSLIGVTVSSLVLQSALLFGYLRGFAAAPIILTVFITIAQSFVGGPEISFYLIVPPAVALVLAPLAWVPATAIITYVVTLVRADFAGPLASPGTIVVFVLIIAAMLLSRLTTENALREARLNAQEASDARQRAEQQAAEITTTNAQLASQVDEQQRLLELVTMLETPVVDLAAGVLLAPIVGQIDTRRSQDLRTRLLERVHSSRAQLVVLDIGGVTSVDTYVARALLDTARALRLLGCDVVISGITTPVAITLVRLGVDLGEVTTVRSPQDALALYAGKL